jgi:hypothetical protein
MANANAAFTQNIVDRSEDFSCVKMTSDKVTGPDKYALLIFRLAL